MFTLIAVILISFYVHGSYIGNIRSDSELQFFAVLAFVLPFMAYFIMRRAVLSDTQLRSFLVGVGLITLYLGVTGIGELSHQNWLVFPRYILNPKEGIHFGYVRGPFVQASWDGLAMAMGVPIILWLLFQRGEVHRWVWVVAIISVGVSVPYVFQRAAWLSTVAAAGIATLMCSQGQGHYAFRLHCAFIGMILLILPIAAAGLPSTLETGIAGKLAERDNVEFRYELTEVSGILIAEHPLAGVGFEKFRQAISPYLRDEEYSSHNTVLTLFAELGVMGVIPYGLIFCGMFFSSAKAFRRTARYRPIIGAIWGITAAYIVMLLAVELRGVLYVNILFFALWGMLLAIVRRKIQADGEGRPINFATSDSDCLFVKQNNAVLSFG